MGLFDLFTPLWMKGDLTREQYQKASKQISRLSQNTLEIAALESPNWGLRKEAVSRLENRDLLKHIAESDENSSVRREAALKLDKEEMISALYKDSNDENVLLAVNAMQKGDPRLYDVFVKAGSGLYASEIEKNAIRKITDKTLFLKMLQSDFVGPYIDYSDLMPELSREELLYVVLMSEEKYNSDSVYEWMIKNGRYDENCLEQIAESAVSETAREKAKKKLYELELKNRLRKSAHGQALISAWERNDPSAVADVLPHDEDTIDVLIYMLETRTEVDLHNHDIKPSIHHILLNIYKNEPELHPILKSKNLSRFNEEHDDRDFPTCHYDLPGYNFDF